VYSDASLIRISPTSPLVTDSITISVARDSAPPNEYILSHDFSVQGSEITINIQTGSDENADDEATVAWPVEEKVGPLEAGRYHVTVNINKTEYIYAAFDVDPIAQADFDGDGYVRLGDFFLFADHFGSSNPVFDLNRDGIVDLADFFILADQFERTNEGGLGEGRKEITVDLPGGAQMEFVWIEPGIFMMGSPDSESGRKTNEGPHHEVTISQGFYLGKYEITQAQWESVMDTTPWSGQDYVQEDANNPAVYISWDDMQAFIHALNEAAGDSLYRLPTEAEWEYACRAGTTTRWSFGDDESQLGSYSWYEGNNSPYGSKEVGTKLPNPWGLYDMHGNVLEWCQDYFHHSYSGENQVDPTGPTSGSPRVLRGGYFYYGAWGVRSAFRYVSSPGTRYGYFGARLLMIREPDMSDFEELSLPAGKALSLDGDGDYVEISDSPSLHSEREITIVGWVKPNVVDVEISHRPIIWKGNSTVEDQPFANREFGVWQLWNGRIEANSTPSNRVGENQLHLIAYGQIQASQWYHFAVVISSDDDNMQIYIDGNLNTQRRYDTSGIRDTEGPLVFGATVDIELITPSAGSWKLFDGSIDEVRIWNRALTAEEIQANMSKTLTGTEEGLVGYWNFDELNEDGLVPDLSGNGNHGTLMGDAQLVESNAPIGQ